MRRDSESEATETKLKSTLNSRRRERLRVRAHAGDEQQAVSAALDSREREASDMVKEKRQKVSFTA